MVDPIEVKLDEMDEKIITLLQRQLERNPVRRIVTGKQIGRAHV